MTDMVLTPTTELEAVNAMLSAIGESPVNTLENPGLLDAAKARQQLSLTSRRVQSRGWHWNTDESLTLTPDQDGNLNVPANTLKVDTAGDSEDMDLVQRGVRLYDRVNHTYTFSEDVTVDCTCGLNWDELPEVARHFILISAARTFQQGTIGSVELDGFKIRDEVLAWAAMVTDEAENADSNILTGNSTMARVLVR